MKAQQRQKLQNVTREQRKTVTNYAIDYFKTIEQLLKEPKKEERPKTEKKEPFCIEEAFLYSEKKEGLQIEFEEPVGAFLPPNKEEEEKMSLKTDQDSEEESNECSFEIEVNKVCPKETVIRNRKQKIIHTEEKVKQKFL